MLEIKFTVKIICEKIYGGHGHAMNSFVLSDKIKQRNY